MHHVIRNSTGSERPLLISIYLDKHVWRKIWRLVNSHRLSRRWSEIPALPMVSKTRPDPCYCRAQCTLQPAGAWYLNVSLTMIKRSIIIRCTDTWKASLSPVTSFICCKMLYWHGIAKAATTSIPSIFHLTPSSSPYWVQIVVDSCASSSRHWTRPPLAQHSSSPASLTWHRTDHISLLHPCIHTM